MKRDQLTHIPVGATRVLTVRYVGALFVIAALLVAGQAAMQIALDHQEGDSRIVNIAGRQRMLSQRLCMLLLEYEHADASATGELERVADEWKRSQEALVRRDNTDAVRTLFDQIAGDHRAMLKAAQTVAAPNASANAATALAHQEAFLIGMDRIVAQYEQEARDRVVRLKTVELALLATVLVVLVLVGVLVFRPAVRSIRAHLAERDEAQQALLQATDREQQRIAQDLHDGLGQHLVGVSYLVKSVGEDLAGTPGEARIAEIGRLLAVSIAETRGIARNLFSPTLEVNGLVEALRELAAHAERVFEVACRVHAPTPGIELPMPVRGHLYRIAREAVINAAKHAHAHEIDIEVATTAGVVTVVVRDDGVGIQTPPQPGMGLRLAESRAKMIGASLQIVAQPTGGTRVSCTLPRTEPHG